MRQLLVFAAAGLLVASGTTLAHECPYDWNIKLPKGLSFNGTPLSNALDQINVAVREATKGRIQHAAFLDTSPVVISRQSGDPEIASRMDALIKNYHKEMETIIAKGAEGYETCPVTEDIAPNFPLACELSSIAAGSGMRYQEKKEGAIFSRWPAVLECKAYKVTDALLKLVQKKQASGRIHPDFKPVPVVFAQESGMTWTVMVGDGPRSFKGDFVLDAVTLYLPDRKLMLILETPEGHKKVYQNLKKLGYVDEY